MAPVKQTIKRIVGPGRIAAVRRLLARAELLVTRLCASTRFTSGCYYVLFRRRFSREMQAVLRGRLEFDRRRRDPGASSALLRRNIHRLEKGLIMKERRPLFALDYIGETVAAYVRQAQAATDGAGAAELRWAHDVLTRYFDVSAEHALVERARRAFAQAPSREFCGATPAPRSEAPALSVSYEAFYQLSRRRRSVRWFENRPVPPELIDQAVRVAAQAPSACNRQPFFFRIFTDRARVAAVAGIPMGTKGFAQGFPAVAVLVGDLAAYYDERDRHVVYIDGSLAAMSFMFALETLGLASCPINWPDIEPFERQMDQALQLAAHERPIMLIAFGYPDPNGQVPHSAKKELPLLRTFNR